MSELRDHSTIVQLELQGWHIVDAHANAPFNQVPIVALNKTYPNGIDVIISVHQGVRTYIVYSDAEHRVSGPNVTNVGEAATLEEAIPLVQKRCQLWDAAAVSW
jgi:hypothetical protein